MYGEKRMKLIKPCTKKETKDQEGRNDNSDNNSNNNGY